MYLLAVTVVQATGYYLSYRDIAIISNLATDSEVADKGAYDTLIRPGFAFKQIGDAVVIVRSTVYCWTKIVFTIVTSDLYFR